MTPGLVAAVLEGFEGTLEGVLERVDEGDLKRELEELRTQIATKRQQFEAWEATTPIMAVS